MSDDFDREQALKDAALEARVAVAELERVALLLRAEDVRKAAAFAWDTLESATRFL